MKKFILTLGMVPFIGFGQDSIIFIDENFNIPIFEVVEYEVSPSNNWWFELFEPNLYDGTPCLKSLYPTDGIATITWPLLEVSNIDSLKIIFNSKGNCCGGAAYRKLQISTDSITWFDHSSLSFSNEWISNESSITWLMGNIDQLYLRLKLSFNSPFYLDNFYVVGYTEEVFSDLCGFDIDNSGTINMNDLLEVLVNFGAEVNCN